jgi:class 3 adenylate cyclase
MRRLRRRDILLLATLVPAWAIFVSLHAKEAIQTGLARPPLFVSAPETADAYPRVRGIYVGRKEAAEQAGIRVGDRLLHVGGVDVRGAGHIRVDALISELGGAKLEVPVGFERGGERRETILPLVPSPVPWGRLPVLLVSGVVAVIILLRAPSARQGREVFFAGMLWLLLISDFGGGPRLQTQVWKTIHPLLTMTVIPLMLRWAQNFPDEAPARRRLARAWPWLFMPLHALPRAGYVFGGPVPPEYASAAAAAVDGLSVVVFLGVLTQSYRRTDPVGRRQIKWVLYGFYVGLMPFALTSTLGTLPSLVPWREALFGISMVFTVACVGGYLIAIVRFHLFDIDRLISATASYTILGILVVAGLLTVVPRLAEAASPILGLTPTAGQIVLSALLASIAVPANRALHPWIDRLFFSERYALQQGIGRLLHDLRERGPAYTPGFVRGRAVPPAFAADGSLAAALRQTWDPVPAEVWSRARGGATLGALDRAALETLAAALVAPIRRGERLVSFLCLGRKRSGDVYTHTDRALLGAVCERLGIELVRFGEAELLRQRSEMYSQLRRYVPEAVASRLERGEELAPRELEISVLFVDIRGYTSLVEGLQAREIFSTVNRYTEAVSKVVRKHGGSVVEFNGDGMMVVFGAPEPLARKERAAVEAAREIVAAVAAIPASIGRPGQLDVGVGIATGTAFVGSLRSADRLIWSAIGNTTNLASRLQALTRELGASVVVDAPTRNAAGPRADDFELIPDQPIRGRAARVDLFSLSSDRVQ